LICQSCGEMALGGREFCARCGAPVRPDARTGAAPAVVAGAAMLGGSMPLNRVQQGLRRAFPGVAANPWFGIVLGSCLAMVLGLAATWVLTTVAGAFIGWQALQAYLPLNLQGMPLVVDTFTVVMQRATLVLTTMSPAGVVTGTATVSPPITLLLLVPALALTAGGYVAASTDWWGRPRASFARGAGVALPCALLLAFLGQLGASSGATSNGQIVASVNTISLILYGLLWGVLFGGAGALLRLYGKPARALGLALARRPRPRWLAPALGGLAAVGYGAGFAMAAFVATLPALALLETQLPAVTNTLRGSLAGLIAAVLLLLPGLAILLLGVAGGAPVHGIASGAPGPLPAGSAQFSLVAASGHPPALYMLLILPAMALFLGGRVAARTAGAPSWLARLASGALSGIPYALLLTALSWLATAGLTATGQAGGAPLQTTAQVGLGSVGTLVTALLAGVIFGALGGLSVSSRAVREYQRQVPLPVSVGRRLRQTLRLAALLLGLAVIFGGVLVTLSGVLSYPTVVALAAIGAFIATLLPLALLVVATGTALAPLPPAAG
jgi:hypothetical protein